MKIEDKKMELELIKAGIAMNSLKLDTITLMHGISKDIPQCGEGRKEYDVYIAKAISKSLGNIEKVVIDTSQLLGRLRLIDDYYQKGEVDHE